MTGILFEAYTPNRIMKEEL